MTAGSRCTLRFVPAIAVFLAAGALDTAAAASSGGQQFAQAAGIPGGAHSSARKLDGEDARFLLERTRFAPDPPMGVDFRALYATVLDRWWGIDSRSVLAGRFDTLPVLKT